MMYYQNTPKNVKKSEVLQNVCQVVRRVPDVAGVRSIDQWSVPHSGGRFHAENIQGMESVPDFRGTHRSH